LLSIMETLSVADMESINENEANRPSDPDALTQGLTDVHSRMASRLHSPWWFHAARGLLFAVMVFGQGTHAWWGQWLSLAGLLAVILLSRGRTRAAGFSRSNPDRWSFLTLGAPWSVLMIFVFAAALALVVVDRHLARPELIGVAVVVGLLAAVFGPLADRAGRARMGHPSTALPRS
jgi:hypothetical protein